MRSPTTARRVIRAAKRVLRDLIAPAALALAAACGADATPAIGAACAGGETCGGGPRTACITAWPQGYCTELDCELGSCAQGARCVRGIAFLNVPFDAFCLSTCSGPADCRTGYRCSEVGGGASVCAPENP